MLQICTGKFFETTAGRTNQLRGILYTNLKLDMNVETVVGKLIPSTDWGVPSSLTYELIEQIENGEVAAGTIVSHGINAYIQDMAIIFSFGLNCICTPDIDLARRLISGEKNILTVQAPNKLIRRIFDKEIWANPDEVVSFINFVKQLIGLERKTYLAVIKAIRTYVTGLHRIADDIELAYTLMVVSVESLAQEFDGHEATWSSLEERKRLLIDNALNGATEETIKKVRDAILKSEHVALSRRFKEFVNTYINPNYFTSGFNKEDNPIGKSEITEVLNLAYQARSKYIHQLKQLPPILSLGGIYNETCIPVNSRKKMLTLHGLSRLMRHVIIEFVNKQPILEKESYPYFSERVGIITMELAAEYWVGKVEGDITKQGKIRLEGFISQIAGFMTDNKKSITDMRNVIRWFSENIDNIRKDHRLPYLAIYAIFNSFVSNEQRLEFCRIQEIVDKELVAASSESLLTHALFNVLPEWKLEKHEQVFEDYKNRRGAKTGIRFPRLFEAAIAIQLAERYRLQDMFHKCIDVINNAADDFPENENLRVLVGNLSKAKSLKWQEILFSKNEKG